MWTDRCQNSRRNRYKDVGALCFFDLAATDVASDLRRPRNTKEDQCQICTGAFLPLVHNLGFGWHLRKKCHSVWNEILTYSSQCTNYNVARIWTDKKKKIDKVISFTANQNEINDIFIYTQYNFTTTTLADAREDNRRWSIPRMH